MKLSRLGIIGLFSFMLIGMGCSKPPKLAKGSGGGEGAPTEVDNPSEQIFTAKSLELFQAELYDPLVEAQCKNCHHETEHHPDVETSFNYFTDGQHASFTKSDSSSVVVRVRGGHSCWSDCVEDSSALLAGINSWFTRAEEELGWVRPEVTYDGGKTAEVAFIDATDHVLDIDPNEYLGGSIDIATTTNAWQNTLTDDPDGAINSYIMAPPGGNPRNQGDAAAGTAAFNIDVLTAGTYFAWIRTKMLDADQNEYFLSDGTNTFQAPAETESTGDAWTWKQLELLNQDDVLEPQPLTLAAGPQTITLQEREGGVKIAYLLITSRTDPNTEIFNTKLYDVAVDISDLVGTNAKIIATVWEKAQGDEQAKAIGVKELRVESDKPLHIKGIYPLINGDFESYHATYSLVDGTFGGSEVRAEQIIQTGAATGTTWLSDYAADKLSFGFDVLEVAE